MDEKKKKELAIRSSAAEYLTFVASTGESDASYEMRYEDENIWLTQKMMAALYDVDVRTVNEHIKKIYADGELTEQATIRKFRIVQTEGTRQVNRELTHYNLQLIIAVGFKVNNQRAVQFRKWAGQIVKDHTIQGWTMDVDRLKKGHMFTDEYFERQLQQIREIRLSERKFYQKVTDLYATAFDYDKNAKTTRLFFQTVQNKMHYAVHRHTAAELIVERADANKEHMGLTTWENAPDGKILKADVTVAKNYLSKEEMNYLERIVSLYLDYAELLGEYGKIFEKEYLSVLNEHRTLFDPAYTAYLDSTDVHDVHKGYFSIDKKGHSVNSSVKRGSDMSDDISAYDLILKNKERLLSFEEPTRFIFSHSALREGWDNPNVFQICTLKHSDSTTQKRQEVGRGLRLCVNKDGNRMDAEVLGDKVQDINVLTVIASESYAGFVDGLQKQTEAVLYDRPRKADIAYFTGKTIRLDGKIVKVDDRQARAIYQYLVRNNYVDEQDNVTQDYRDDVQTGTLAPVPETLKPIEEGVHTLVQAIYDDSMLKSMFEDGNKPKVLENPLNDRFEKAEFQKLWQTINHKYAYTVDFDSEELIQKAIVHIDRELYVSRLQYTVTYAGQKDVLSADMVREGSSFSDAKSRTKKLEHDYAGQVAYDLIGKIAEGTTLTRHTVARILQGIKPTTFAMYQNNPEEFIAKVIRLVKEQKATMIVEHITYDTIEGSYDSSIFTAEKHALTMDKAYKAQKAIQDYVFTDGTAEKSVERKFAENLDGAEEVFIYAKLPKGFYIPTPVGHYSPDWAIVFHEGKVKHIYFVAETKGTMESLNLRPIEKSKIDCAKKLFAKLSDGLVTYDHVDSYQELMNKVLQ